MPESADDLPELANDLRLACQRLARRVRFESTAAIAPHQMAVLMKLRTEPHTPTWLADAERVSAPSMSRTVNCLAEDGLVQRTPHPDDGRQVLVSLTDDGRAAVEAALRDRDTWMMQRLAPLSVRERKQLREAVTLLERVISE